MHTVRREPWRVYKRKTKERKRKTIKFLTLTWVLCRYQPHSIFSKFVFVMVEVIVT